LAAGPSPAHRPQLRPRHRACDRAAAPPVPVAARPDRADRWICRHVDIGGRGGRAPAARTRLPGGPVTTVPDVELRAGHDIDVEEGSRAPAFTVHLSVFEGPFDLLLSLIAKHRLDITEVAL